MSNTLEKTIECSECGNEVDPEETYGTDDTPICYDCYRDSLTDCQICEEGVEEEEVSEFIVVKTEFSETGNRLPGIYRIKSRPFMTCSIIGSGWLHGGDILFIDRLPRRDSKFKISGNICCRCADPYKPIDSRIYGASKRWDVLRRRERRRVVAVVAAHPEMLLDLETDTADADLHRWCPIPVFAPTYRPRLFLEHRGVKIYWNGEWANWLSLRPEPSKRNATYRMARTVFSPRGLKTWEPIKLEPDRMKDQWGKYYDSGYRYGHEYDFVDAAKAACRRAIDLGLVTQTTAPDDAR